MFFIIPGCLAVDETQKDEEVYVVDADTVKTPEPEAPKVEETPAPEPVPAPVEEKFEEEYIVQIGAFTTQTKAEAYARENKKFIHWQYKIFHSNEVGLYVIHLDPVSVKTDAEAIRDRCWKEGKLSDAFIITRRK